MKGALSLVLKWLLFLASFSYIVYKVNKDPGSFSFDLFTEAFGFPNAVLFMGLITCLLPLNWGLETLKWKYLLRTGGLKVSFREATQQVLCGVSLGIFTPNRIGEIAGKVLMTDKRDRGKAIALSLVGSMTQFLATITWLLIATCVVKLLYEGEDPAIDKMFNDFTVVLGYAAICITALILFVVNLADKNLPYALNRHFRDFLSLIKGSRQAASVAYAVSCLRYVVFWIQYWIVLYWFGIVDPDWIGFLLIPLIYFTSSAIPMFFPGDISVRGAAAVFFLEPVCVDTEAILFASLFIWLLNVGLPALVGSVFIFSFKLFDLNARN